MRRGLVGEVGLVFPVDRPRGWWCVWRGGLLHVVWRIGAGLRSMIGFVRQVVGKLKGEVEGY